eukprot:3063012-Pyramimonas_sp.AAC.1
MRKLKRRDARRRREGWARELVQAMEARDGRLAWQLSRLIAGTRLGPKRRRYNAFTAVPPNI